MPKHTTNDPAEKAFSIAQKETDKAFEEDGDYGRYFEVLNRVFAETIREMQPLEDGECERNDS